MRVRGRAMLVLALTVFGVAVGCGSFQPRPLEEIPFKERVEVEERDGPVAD